MGTPLHFIGISGSLRKDSWNTALLRATEALLPEGVTMDIVSIRDLPLYDEDLDMPAASERPGAVRRFRDAVAAADALVIVSPEYNYSIPGGLKNALDWASRGDDAPLRKKPVALMGATPGLWGTVRMQTAFLPVFLTLGMKVAEKPEVLVARADKKLDVQGKITDDTTREMVRKKMQALKDLVTSLPK